MILATRNPVTLLTVAMILTACTSAPQAAERPDRRAETTTTTTTVTKETAVATTVPGANVDDATLAASTFDGLLTVDAATGDVLRLDGRQWRVVYDGPSYDDETVSSYVESATNAGENEIVSLCCEPVVGILRSTGGGLPYVGYGTWPAHLDGRVVAFHDTFTEPDQSALLVTRVDSDDPAETLIPLPGVAAHGRRLTRIDETRIAFTWTGTPDDADQTWYLTILDVDRNDTTPPTVEVLPEAMDLVATRDGRLLLHSTVDGRRDERIDAPVEVYEYTHREPSPGLRRLGQAPAGTFALAAAGMVFLALADSGASVGTLDAMRPVTGAPRPPVDATWIGW